MAEDLSISVSPSPDSVADQVGSALARSGEAGASAVVTALPTVVANVTRRLAAIANLPYPEVASGVSILAGAASTGSVAVSGDPVPLIDFIGTFATPAGASVLVRRGAGREVVAGTFIPKLRSGFRSVFHQDRNAPRVPYVGNKPGPHKGHQPIRVRTGPSLSDLLAGDPNALSAIRAEAGASVGAAVATQLSGLFKP